MGRKSSIRKLHPDLRREIDRLLDDERFTLEQVTDHMRTLGAEVSKSAVQRYNVQFQELRQELRVVREMSDTVGRELGESDDHTRLIVESLQALLIKARMQHNGKDEIDDRSLKNLTESARNLAVALKSSVDTELKVRERFAREAAAEVEKEAKSEGLSADTIERVKAKILGLASGSR